jgi:MSHA biogenesis protein MshL
MKRTILTVLILGLAACAEPPKLEGLEPSLKSEAMAAGERKRPAPPAALDQALLPPPQMAMPEVRGVPIDAKFDLSVNNAPAAQVFQSIVSGTRYSMLMHPGVGGTVSVHLKDVTIREALDSLRELYGYDYKVEGTRIFVHPSGLQTRLFQVSYLTSLRKGLSEVRVQSGAVSDSTGAPGSPGSAPNPTQGGAPSSRSLESARVSTEQQTSFWTDLRAALLALVGTGEGRSVVVTPHSGVVVVRAFPSELRAVESYLHATRISVERQVMLEAKIVEVTLSQAYQAGINWASFRGNANIGQLSPGTSLGTLPQTISTAGLASSTGRAIAAATAQEGSLAAGIPALGVFGLALQTSNFAALLTFLESQGNVQVLSSPRIATVNNQKAVLKVGTDEFFVTNVSTTSTTTGTTTQNTPSVTVQPFFSGVVLDVTPQIDAAGNIILHIHPAVSEVVQSNRVIDLGGQISTITLPLAKSTVSETDTIVRVEDGNIVAIGGLMKVDARDISGGLPGVPDSGIAGALLRNNQRTLVKKELVILLKPTVIESDRQWGALTNEPRQRLEDMDRPVRNAR